MAKAILYDATKCTACRGCQAACKHWNELEAEETKNTGSYENPADLSYALQDTKTPVRIAVIGVVSNLLLSLLLMGTLKHSGLALANSFASIMNFLLLSFFLRKKLQRIDAGKFIKSFLQVIASSCIMGVIGWALLRGELWTGSGSAAMKAGYLSGSILICIIMYTVLNDLMKNEELSYVREMLSIKFHKRMP